jgi:CPA2 family monovalent cation:H+ antiporter-2
LRPYPWAVDVSAPLILDIAVVLLAAAAAGWLARRIGLPAVVGYLVVGLAVSPFTPGYVVDREQLRVLADIGVVLLLFEVGIEVDVARIRQTHRSLLWVVPAQMVGTMAVAALVLVGLGVSQEGAALLGLAVAFSSSVVVVNITRSKRRTTDRPTEATLLGWSVLQDVVGVALAAILLTLIGLGERPVWEAIGALVVYGLIAFVVARALPRILGHLQHEHDLFLIVAVATGLGVAALGSLAFGVPLALAAFIAGLAVTDGAETAEARRRLLPLRDVLAVLFFVLIGTLLDPSLLPTSWPMLLAMAGLVGVVKVVPAYALARLGRLPGRPVQVAVGLGQMGEFSFVLASAALSLAAIDAPTYAATLGAVVVTIALSTVLVRRVGRREAEAAQAA